MPLFVWSELVIAPLLALPYRCWPAPITMLLTDRNSGTAFFDLAGAAIRCYSWFLGHLYIMSLPAIGIVS